MDKINIKQSSKQAGTTDDRWEWSIWIDEPEEVLQQIDFVKYILHSTFPNRERKRTSPRDKFKLSSEGWGEFEIFIQVHFKDGRTPLYTSHYLQLSSEQSSKESKRKKVFLSSQLSTKEEALKVKEVLEKKNIDVLSAEELDVADLWSKKLVEYIKEADVFVLFGQSHNSRYQEFELKHARELGKQIVVVDKEGLKSTESENTQIFRSSEDLINYVEKMEDE